MTQLRELLSYLLFGFTTIFMITGVIIHVKYKSQKKPLIWIMGAIPAFLAIPFFHVPQFLNGNSLSKKTQTIELTYISWACDCANWVTQNDLIKYSENIGDSLAHQSIFIEPADPSLILPDTLGYGNDVVMFTGKFYQKRAFPKGFRPFGNAESARVFRYTNYEVVLSHYNLYKEADQ